MAGPIPARLSRREGREFGLTVGGALLVIAGILLWRQRQLAAYVVMLPGIMLMLAGLFLPTRLGPVRRAWMALAHAISKVTTPIVLGVIYFLLLTPIGLLMRATGRDPLRLPPDQSTRWWLRKEGEQRSRLERQF